MPPLRYLFVDTETTGLDPSFHEIIEIGCLIAEPRMDLFGKETYIEVDAREWRMHPDFPERAQPEALRVNGYGARDWSDAVPRTVALREFIEFGKGTILIAQNVTFDWGFLREGAKRHGVMIDTNIFSHKFDLMSMAFQYSRTKNPDLRRFSLAAMCEYFGIENTHAHRALSDARAAFSVFKRLIEE